MNQIQSTHAQRQTLNIEEVAHILGINRTTAYELASRNALPVPVIRLGRRMVVSRFALETVLAAQQSRDDRDV